MGEVGEVGKARGVVVVVVVVDFGWVIDTITYVSKNSSCPALACLFFWFTSSQFLIRPPPA